MEPILELTKDNIQDVVDASMKQVVVLAFGRNKILKVLLYIKP